MNAPAHTLLAGIVPPLVTPLLGRDQLERDLVLRLGRNGEDDPIDADLLAEPQPIQVLGDAEDGYGQAGGIASGGSPTTATRRC